MVGISNVIDYKMWFNRPKYAHRLVLWCFQLHDKNFSSIYIQLDGVLTSISTPVGYLPMHPARPGETALSEGADFMIRKMFQVDAEEPETDYEVLDAPADPYARRDSESLVG